MTLASVAPCTSSRGTTRKKPVKLDSVRSTRVADGEMYAMLVGPTIGAMAINRPEE